MIADGLMAALITSYDDEGKISLERQADLIDHVLMQGLQGLFVSGSTGEAYLQTVDERIHTISGAIEHVDGRAAVVAHTAAMDTPTTISLTERAVEAGADAIAVVTPIYYIYDDAQFEQYFRDVAAASSDVPVIAYHIPARTHVDLSPDFFVKLAHEGILQGLKYTSTNLYPLAEVARKAPQEFRIFNGSDEVLLGGLALGAHGGIGSTYNVIGAVYATLVENFRASELRSARLQQDLANQFIEEMNGYDFLVFLREALRFRGIETGHGRRPLPTITSEEHDRIFGFLTSFETNL